jgi:hypothetical protein
VRLCACWQCAKFVGEEESVLIDLETRWSKKPVVLIHHLFDSLVRDVMLQN